jgi:hypothetical protein
MLLFSSASDPGYLSILESRNGRCQGWGQVKDEARESPVRFLGYGAPIRKGNGGPQKPSSWLSEGVRDVFTINTESSEMACVLRPMITNAPTRGHDTVKQEVREEQERTWGCVALRSYGWGASSCCDLEVGGLKRSNTHVLLVLQLVMSMA